MERDIEKVVKIGIQSSVYLFPAVLLFDRLETSESSALISIILSGIISTNSVRIRVQCQTAPNSEWEYLVEIDSEANVFEIKQHKTSAGSMLVPKTNSRS